MSEPLHLTPEFPAKLVPELFTYHRYKVLYGGRGAARSWSIARALLLRGVERPLRVLCCREYQLSIRDSVHRLLCDQIYLLGLGAYYRIEQSKIFGPNGTEFSFEGIKNNPTKLKSFEGADVCWVEEAENVSKDSWDILIPTIRKEDSEIWVSFNPKLVTDETYVRMVMRKPSADAFVCEMTWEDNPWFPSVLEAERLTCLENDPDGYANIWGGKPLKALEGAVYKNELRKADLEGRLTTPVPYSKLVPVDTYWDLGKSDFTAIWFVQQINFEIRLIDYYENRGFDVDHYTQVLQTRGYTYGDLWLPHDAKAKRLGAKKTVEEQIRLKGFHTRLVPVGKIFNGIAAGRQVFPQCWFDPVKCQGGIHALQHYRYEVKDGQFSQNPLHDDASHGADAFRYMGVAIKPGKTPVQGVGAVVKKALKLRLGLTDSAGLGQRWMR